MRRTGGVSEVAFHRGRGGMGMIKHTGEGGNQDLSRESGTSARKRSVAVREEAVGVRESALDTRELSMSEREELARLRDQALRTRDELADAMEAQNNLLCQMREANEKLVLTTVRAEELAEQATAARLEIAQSEER